MQAVFISHMEVAVEHYKIAERIRATARRIPLGGSISIRGDDRISSYNFAEAVARIVEKAATERDLYSCLCDDPE